MSIQSAAIQEQAPPPAPPQVSSSRGPDHPSSSIGRVAAVPVTLNEG